MKSSSIATITVIVVVTAMAPSARADSMIMVSDENLVVGARAIVMGEVRGSQGQLSADGIIYTYVCVRVSEVLHGDVPTGQIVLKQLGGTVGDRNLVVSGSPTFSLGESVFLYLDTSTVDGTLRVSHLALGKFTIVVDPAAGGREVVRAVPRATTSAQRPLDQGRRDGDHFTSRMELGAYRAMVRRILLEQTTRVQRQQAIWARRPLVTIPPEVRHSISVPCP